MRWVAAAVALAVVGVVAMLLLRTSPVTLLSFLDGVMGGGRGTRRVGTGIAFGTHGQSLDVWRPADRAHDPRPVVIFWYGGGWAHGTRTEYAFAGRAFASQGFVVVIPDYRKVPSVHFPAMIEDGAQAVKWVRDHAAEFGGDPQRIALAGHSAGAYTVAMLALDPHWLQAEGVDPRIVKAGVGLSGPYDFYPFTAKRAIDAMSRAPDPLATQPISFARGDAPPLLLVTSSKDSEVRPKNAINLTRKLRAAGAPVEFRSYRGLTHEDVAMALSKPFRGKGTVLADAAAFLHRRMQ